jgi:hypothetical protein
MTTHPASANAESAAGGRRVKCSGRCIRSAFAAACPEAGAAETVFTGEIRDQSQLYGLLDRVRDLGLELVSVQPQPVADPTKTTHIRKDL